MAVGSGNQFIPGVPQPQQQPAQSPMPNPMAPQLKPQLSPKQKIALLLKGKPKV